MIGGQANCGGCFAAMGRPCRKSHREFVASQAEAQNAKMADFETFACKSL